VSLDDNRIECNYRERHGASFDGSKVDDRRALDTFDRADAQRFVDAVRARLAERAAEGAAPAAAGDSGGVAAPR